MKNMKIWLFVLVFLIAFIPNAFSEAGKYGIVEIGSASAQINSHGSEIEVTYVITDPLGRKLGDKFVPDGDVESFREFGSFGFTGLGCNSENPDDPNDPCYEYVEILSLESMFNLIEGTYTIEASAGRLTEFRIGIHMSDRNIDKRQNFDKEGVIDKDLTSKIQFTYSADPSKPWTVTRVATSGSLKQDITLARKVGWIDNDGIMTSLLKKAEAIEASIQKDRKKTTENLIKAFINEVNAQAGKHISKEAVKMLTEDANYIMNNL